MRLWIYAVLCLVALVAPARAAVITVLFEGTVEYVSDTFDARSWGGGLHVGDPFQYRITYDDAATGFWTGSGMYYAINDAEIVAHLGSFTYTGSGLSIELENDVFGNTDFVLLHAGLSASAQAEISLLGDGGTGLIPSTNLTDVDWTRLAGRSMYLTIWHYGSAMQLIETSSGGDATSITLVPEPATALLIGALGVAAGVRRVALSSRD